MPITAALSARAHAALLLVVGALAVAFAAAAGPNPGALLTAVAASAALAVVATVSWRALVVAPSDAALRIGQRGHAHREAFDHEPEPSHPDTTGRTRSRAPGEVARAA